MLFPASYRPGTRNAAEFRSACQAANLSSTMSRMLAAIMPGSSSALETLHDAARQGQERLCKLLIWRGVDINSMYERPGLPPATPLYLAAAEGHLVLVRLLIQAGANVNLSNPNGLTPLHEAAWRGDSEIARELLAAGASPLTMSQFGTTPLHDAVLGNHMEIIALLIKHGANVNAADSCGNTALLRACEAGSIETIAYLLNNGADTNLGNVFGDTPLHRAVGTGHMTVTRLLLIAGARLDAKDNRSLMPIEISAKGQSVDQMAVSRILLQFGSPLTPHAVSFWNPRFIDEVIEETDLSTECLLTAERRGATRAPFLLHWQRHTEQVPPLALLCVRKLRVHFLLQSRAQGVPLSDLVVQLPVPVQLHRRILYSSFPPLPPTADPRPE
eukprot:m.261520 g.261520  ORF g.261520 m.261520 type:complete len:387 (+) comp54610_c0_seq11:92-1252(+)